MSNTPKIYSLVIGRFQCLPSHAGHRGIIDKLLKEGKNVCIALKEEDGTDKNPYTQAERKQAFEEIYGIYGDRVKIIYIPNIEEVVYGRKVGWRIREIRLDEKTEKISATDIRKNNSLKSNSRERLGT